MADPRCTCDDEDGGRRWCNVHAGCDDPTCRALQNPTTLEELRVAHNHWKNHGYLFGCSHGG